MKNDRKRCRKLNFPFSEANLLKGLTPHLAHSDELASISAKELRSK